MKQPLMHAVVLTIKHGFRDKFKLLVVPLLRDYFILTKYSRFNMEVWKRLMSNMSKCLYVYCQNSVKTDVPYMRTLLSSTDYVL